MCAACSVPCLEARDGPEPDGVSSHFWMSLREVIKNTDVSGGLAVLLQASSGRKVISGGVTNGVNVIVSWTSSDTEETVQ